MALLRPVPSLPALYYIEAPDGSVENNQDLVSSTPAIRRVVPNGLTPPY